MKYGTYIFDLDGTLLNTLEDLKNSTNYAMKQMGYPTHSKDEVRRFVGNGIAMLIKRAVPKGTDEADESKALEIFKSHYIVHLNDNTAPYPGIIDMLKKLKSKGCKTGVVTNKNEDAAKKLIERYFGTLFDCVVGHRDGLASKPDPAALGIAMRELNAEKSSTIFIGDSDVDVMTAHNADLKCIGVLWGFRDEETLKSVGAEYIVSCAKDILSI